MPVRGPWGCGADSNAGLVQNLADSGILTGDRVANAMKQVDRAKYTSLFPYEDSPQTIGHGATISAPHMHAAALSNLQDFLKPGMKALDVGSGSGYLTACMAKMVGDTGKVVGIDHIPELVEESRVNIQKDNPQLLESGRVVLVAGDGRKGYPAEAPYDCIHVGAAAPHLPDELIEQLKAPGRMFIPVGTYEQAILQVDKDASGKITKKPIMGVMYVPLTDREKQEKMAF